MVAHVVVTTSRAGCLVQPVVNIMGYHGIRAEPGLNSAYLDGAENGRRVGEFAIGTNIGLSRLVGNLLQDEKMPGVHIAFGRPYPEETGATWTSSVHVDLVPARCSVLMDGDIVMSDGRFDFEMLGLPTPQNRLA
jgi:leucyl aminopeptidase (aminopeptidase T)